MKQRRDAAPAQPVEFELLPEDNSRLATLCGPLDQNLRLVEQRLGVEVRRGATSSACWASARPVPRRCCATCST